MPKSIDQQLIDVGEKIEKLKKKQNQLMEKKISMIQKSIKVPKKEISKLVNKGLSVEEIKDKYLDSK